MIKDPDRLQTETYQIKKQQLMLDSISKHNEIDSSQDTINNVATEPNSALNTVELVNLNVEEESDNLVNDNNNILKPVEKNKKKEETK